MALNALDGRYGEQYVVSSPETVRMCVSSHVIHKIQNGHENMSGKDLRIQNLEIVRVTRTHQKHGLHPSQPWLRRSLLQPWLASYRHLLVSLMGWMTLLGMIIMSSVLQCYLSLGFLVVVPATGIVIFCLFGSTPRRLLVEDVSEYNRLLIVSEHITTMDWTVFYGESTLVNSLLNRPLEPIGLQLSTFAWVSLRMVLRILVLSQWCLVLGAAALKDWNAYFITFWIVFCIVLHAYLIPPVTSARDWLKAHAKINLERYQTQLSSRRALINTIVALNPDTFLWDGNTRQRDRNKLSQAAMRWVDPILTPGPSRAKWEEATYRAMDEALEKYSAKSLASPEWQSSEGDVLSSDWNKAYPLEKANYWRPFIFEGIHMAAKIEQEAHLSGHMVKLAP